MKVVVDTNVLVAGLLSPFGPPGEIVRMIASGILQVCFDARILTEYEDVLARQKFQFDREHTQIMLEQIGAEGLIVAAEPLPSRLPDPDDEPFLEVAIAGHAHCLVTGNIKHFPPARRQGAIVLSPGEFLDSLRKDARSRTRKG